MKQFGPLAEQQLIRFSTYSTPRRVWVSSSGQERLKTISEPFAAHAEAIVADRELDEIVPENAGDFDDPVVRLSLQSVLDGVFDDGLQRRQGILMFHQPVVDIVIHLQPVAEARLDDAR